VGDQAPNGNITQLHCEEEATFWSRSKETERTGKRQGNTAPCHIRCPIRTRFGFCPECRTLVLHAVRLQAHSAVVLAIASTASRNLFRLKSKGQWRKDAAPQENQQHESC
jgi:hypothetical protein